MKVKTSVILATICFFSFCLDTLHTSSIRAEETWEKVEEGPNKGNYKGKMWGLDALAKFENYNDHKYISFTGNQKYSSEKAAVETCKRIGSTALDVISIYGSYNGSFSVNNEINFGLHFGPWGIKPPIKIRDICEISITNKENNKISARISVEDKTHVVSMQLTLPVLKTQ